MILRFGGYPHEAVRAGTLANGVALYKLFYSGDRRGKAWKLVVVDTTNEAGAIFARGASAAELLGASIPDDGPPLPMKYAQRSISTPEAERWREVQVRMVAREARRNAARKADA